MRKAIVVLALGMAGILPAQVGVSAESQGHPDSSGWKSLFAADLSDAIFPQGVWTVAEGVLTASKDQCIWTKAEYENFVVDLEFKNAVGTNSGVFVYCSSIEKFIPNSVEVQIADDFAPKRSASPATWHCAAFFGHKPAAKSVVRKPGEWKRYEITAVGGTVTLKINGEEVNRATGCDVVAGPICLTAEGDEIQFRNVRIQTH